MTYARGNNLVYIDPPNSLEPSVLSESLEIIYIYIYNSGWTKKCPMRWHVTVLGEQCLH